MNRDDIPEIGRIKRTLVLRLIYPLLMAHLRTQNNRVFAMAVVDMIQRALKTLVFVAVLGVKQIRHYRRFRDNLKQHDPGFLIQHAGTKSTTERT